MSLNQTQILTTLAYLMGERTVNATTSAPRADFIQETLNDLYSAYPWRFASANATLSISSGIATLPTNFDVSNQMYASWFTDATTEKDLDEIDPADKDQVNDGDNKFWLTPTDDGTMFLLNTKDSTPSSVVVRYQKLPPVLDSAGTVTTPYPSKMTIAMGARRYVKLGQNPDADISQDEKLFEVRLANDIASHQVPSPRKNRKTKQQQNSTFTGDF